MHDIHRTQGALEQVGGAVARERLRDAIEAFELAERYERDIETEYEAWLLLLEQMKQADTAQASNLGQAFAPAIAAKFEALTQKRYEDVRLTAQLATEGIVVAGTIRPAEAHLCWDSRAAFNFVPPVPRGVLGNDGRA